MGGLGATGGAGTDPGTAGDSGGAGPGGAGGSAGSTAAAGRGGTTGAGGSGGGGQAGNAGSGGNPGSGGNLGNGGSAGGSGASGSAGRGGRGGAGTTGSAGATGSAGTTGAAGTSGAAGRGGTTGGGGTAGTAGTSGGAGTTGSAGTGGSAGTTGSAGTGGSAGTTGAGGGAGAAGSGGSGSGGAAGTGQVVLSIDFIGGRPPMGGAGGMNVIAAPAMTATEVAGVKPVAHWNGAANISGTLASLVLADGTATSASVTWNSPSMGTNPGEWMMGFADMPGDTRMMNGYLDPVTTAMPAVVTVSALPASITAAGYDVYVYVDGDVGTTPNTRTYNYAIGSAMFTVSQTGPVPTSFTAFTLAPAGGAGNYIIFRNVTGAAFTLTATPGTGTATRAPVNGLQIVSPTGS
jgi:hypothetical protein